MNLEHVEKSIAVVKRAKKYRDNSEQGYMLTDNDIITSIIFACEGEVTYDEAATFFESHYSLVK